MPRVLHPVQGLLAVLLVACGRTAAPPAPDARPPRAPDAAPAPRAACEGPGCLPAFRAATVDGTAIASDDLAGKVALVMFWASWCEPCISEGPGIDEVYRRHRGQGFVIVGMSRDVVDDATLRLFQASHHLTYPIVRADDALFGVFGSPPEIPSLFLYGKDGRLRWRGTGALPAEILEGEVVRALAASPTTAPAAHALSLVVARRLDDPARVAALLAERRRAGPTVAILAAERTSASARALNGLRFDAWATTSRPPGVVIPAVAQGAAGTGRRSYTIAQVGGLRVAVVGRGDEPAMARASARARSDGQAHVVVTLGHASGDVDVPAKGPPLEWIELHLDAAGKIVAGERRAVELTRPEAAPAPARGLVPGTP